MVKKSYEYYHGGRTPAEDGEIAARKEETKIKPSVKIIWMIGDTTMKISYANSAEEAEKQITKSRDRRWGKAIMFFWSSRLERYVTVPES